MGDETMRDTVEWFRRESERMQGTVDEFVANGDDFKFTGLDYDVRAPRYHIAADAIEGLTAATERAEKAERERATAEARADRLAEALAKSVAAVKAVTTTIAPGRQEPITEADVLRIANERGAACVAAVRAVADAALKESP